MTAATPSDLSTTVTPPAEEPARSARPRAAGPCRCCRPHDLEALRAAGAVIGERVTIHPDVTIDHPENLVVGDDAQIGPGVRLLTAGGVTIGRRVIIGPGALILSSEPRIPSGYRRIAEAGRRNVAVAIHDDACLGAGAIVNPGVSIEDAVVVAPGCVVGRSVSSGMCVAGNPAAFVRYRVES